MKISGKFDNTFILPLEDNEWYEKLKLAGQSYVRQIKKIEDIIGDKVHITTLEISRFIGDEIRKEGYYPTFKNYRGFPEDLCLSVNKELVHSYGKNDFLQEGDVVTFDFGVTIDDVSVDAARTYIYGKCKNEMHQKMIDVSKMCIDNAISSIVVGKKIGEIGSAIYKTAKNNGFNVINSLGGHAISRDGNGNSKIHSPPFISNKSLPNEGIRFYPGMTLAIEPLLVPFNCSTDIKKGSDGWTIYSEDISCHWEDTVFIHQDGNVEIMTRG